MTNSVVSAKSGELSPQSKDIEKHKAEGWLNLEPDKRSFAMAYIHCNSYIQAARDIGKSGQGLRYFRDPVVRAMISDLQDEMHQISLINRQFVEQKMLETLEKLEGNEAVPMVTGQGIPIEEKKFHSGEVVNLLKEMGKMTGLVQEESIDAGKVNITINMGAMLGEDDDGKRVTIDSTPE